MDESRAETPITISISAVERDTGLSKDTLRVWERRYGFPNPSRDGFGERSYTIGQLDKLRLVKRLMDQGHRPGKIIAYSFEELQQLAAPLLPGNAGADAAESAEELHSYLDLVRAHRIEELRRQLSQCMLRMGLGRFVMDVVSPLNEMIGEAWTRGHLEIFEEHLYTESIQVILRSGIGTIPRPGSRPPLVLLTTFPNEPHGLGLLMTEAVFALEGCRCISLGVQTPLWDIVLAATKQAVDIVALSFSSAVNSNQALDGLNELRLKLPPEVELWAGGSCSVLYRRPPKDVVTLRSLRDIGLALADRRARLQAAA